MRETLSSWIGRRALGRAALGAMDGYGRHATSQFAAAISYRVLFSLVPLVSFLVAVADAVLPDKQRDAVARWLASVVPGQALDPPVEQALTGSRVAPTVAGLVSLVVLLWAASGMMGAIRVAFRVIWENDLRRTFVQSKLLDFLLVLGVGLVAVAALGATLIVQVLAEIGRDLSDKLGAGAEGQVVAGATQILTSGAVTFGILVVLYRFVPPTAPRYPCDLAACAPRDDRLPSRDGDLRALPRSLRRRERGLRAARGRPRLSPRRVRRHHRHPPRCRAGGGVAAAYARARSSASSIVRRRPASVARAASSSDSVARARSTYSRPGVSSEYTLTIPSAAA